MLFYAIAYQFQEDTYYDFEKEETVLDLESTCLLPTKKLAEQIIENELTTDYVPVAIDITRISHNVFSWSRGLVERWED